MKHVIFLVGLFMAFLLGYMLEPKFRLALTGVSPTQGTKRTAPTQVVGDAGGNAMPAPAPAVDPEPAPPVPPEPEPEPVPGIDLASLHPSQLPETVVLKTPVDVTDSESGLTMTVQPDNRVKLVRLEGETVVVSPGVGTFEGFVHVDGTDLLEQLAANPPAPVVPAEEPEPEPEPPTPVVDDEPATDPDPVTLDEGQIVAVMRASLEAGEIKEFTAAQVIGWQAGAEEEVDGVTYQTGLAAYRAETIFGERNIQAKALILDGKVERWIWPQSGMEIR